IVDPRLGVEVVRPEPPLALPAVDHRVGEPLEVAARLPDPRVHQDRRLQPEDVAPEADGGPPPEAPAGALHLHAARHVVPAGGVTPRETTWPRPAPSVYETSRRSRDTRAETSAIRIICWKKVPMKMTATRAS